jgi:hypothetical protein
VATMSDAPKRTGAALRAVSAPVSPALEKVRRGELTVEAYVADRVEQAMARLDPRLGDEEREQVRQVLREHLLTDPLLRQQLGELTRQPLPEH